MKKGQSMLAFFALQLVCIMIFFIVLISVLTMTQNVKFVVRDFDAETASLLAMRRIVSSADCLAYEERISFIDNTSTSPELKFASRIFPNIIDKAKVYDFEHINCMRNDNYDLASDVKNNFWDASKGTGAAFKYDIAVVDLSGPTPVFLTGSQTDSVEIIDKITTSLLSRIPKQLSLCGSSDLISPCYEKCGYFCEKDSGHCGLHPTYNFTIFVDDCEDILECDPENCGEYHSGETDSDGDGSPDTCGGIAVDGRCVGLDGGGSGGAYDVTTAYDDRICVSASGSCPDAFDCYTEDYTDTDEGIQSPPNWFGGSCVNPDNKTSPEGVKPVWTVDDNRTDNVFYDVVAVNTNDPEYPIGFWNQKNTTCFNAKTVKRMTMPVMIYDNGQLKPGLVLIQTCLLEGEKHYGTTLPEILFKAKYVKK